MIDEIAQRASEPLELQLERWRGELTAHCYRMLGSASEAEDAVQETLMRAWRNIDSFEGRSELSTWLYQIATNVCLSALRGAGRRAHPIDLRPAEAVDSPPSAERLPRATSIVPTATAHDANVGDPVATAEMRESIRLAFVVTLQSLPPRQRAVLVLRDVLKWSASEVAELLDTTVAGVNSALQRARASLAKTEVDAGAMHEPLDDRAETLLALYVDAFERYDMDALTALLHPEVNA